MIRRQIPTVMISVALATSLISTATASQVVYDDLGPNNAFQVQSWLIGTAAYNQQIGVAFQAWNTGGLANLTVALTHYAGQNVYDVRLHADSCGQPGTLLQAWLSVATPADSLLHLTPTQNVPLTAGYNYWVVIAAPLGNDLTVGGWNKDSLSASHNSTFLFSQQGGSFVDQCGEHSGLHVEINGTSPSDCPGDMDGDHDVDISDLTLFLSRFGTICP